MTIAERVDEIISRRKSRIPMIEEKGAMLTELRGALVDFHKQRAEMFEPDGTIAEGRYHTILTKYPEVAVQLNQISVMECIQRIDNALEEYKAAMNRFSRDNINISVIGKARIGKSEFLKSISALSNYVIPAFSETDCTGAVSVITNKPGVKLEAVITFKNEKEIIDTVQEYLDRIIPDIDKRIVIHNMYQIRDLDMNVVNSLREKGKAANNLIPYLKKFVEHYEEWAPLITKDSVVLREEKEIQTYVAQNDGNKTNMKYFYKYLAVKSCHISCQYDYPEAGKISLIDTVGFDDHTIGIEDELLRVVNTQCDAAVFMLFPLDVGGGGVPSKIADIYDKIEKSCYGKNLDKWLFWLINHAPNHPKTPNPKSYCETALNTLRNNTWHGELMKIIDVSDQKQVREEFLIPLLDILVGSMDETDDIYFNSFRESLEAVKKEYSKICSIAAKILNSSVSLSGNAQLEIYKNNETLYNDISAKLKTLCANRCRIREIECNELEEEMDVIVNFELEKEGFVPTVDEIKEMLDKQGMQNLNVYLQCCNVLRNKVVSRFSQLNVLVKELMDDLKNEVVDILLETGKLECIMDIPEGTEKYEWLKDFAETYLNKKDYPRLYEAFNNLYQFEFSVNGFLTYEVRACLDALDPDISGAPAFESTEPQESKKIARHIHLALEQKLFNNFVSRLEDRTEELILKPNRALYAAATDFRDAVIYSEGSKMEWIQLFMNYSRELWSDVYAMSVNNSAISQELQNVIDNLVKYNKNTNVFRVTL